MKKRVYSYDIFDTCLIRVCGRPAYVFDILAERILGQDVGSSSKNDFAYIRIHGEQKAREALVHDNCEEVTLDEIYEFCDFSSVTNIPKDVIKQQELTVEAEVLVPVFSIKNEIDSLHSKGKSVIFISDMYLPFEFIREVLISKGLYKDGDKIFLSSKEKKSKSTGNLFCKIHDDYNIDYCEWIHKGDNHWSDYKIPKKLGIKSFRICNSYSTYESKLYNLENSNCKMNRHLIASISKSIRLSNEISPKLSFACDFVAPLFVPFVYHIIEDAKNRGITDIHFLARDGYIFYHIAECFKIKFPDISFHYLYVSRKSLYLPSLRNFEEDELAKCLGFIDNYTLDDICERFQLVEYKNTFEQYKNIKGSELLQKLLKDSFFESCLYAKHSEQRDLCIKYFIQENLVNGHSAIVDLSGTRKCHNSINNILKSSGYNPVFGYYFDVLDEHITGTDYYSVFSKNRYLYNPQIRKDPQGLFEQYFSVTDHTSTASYKKGDNGMICPVFEPATKALTENIETFQINKQVCCTFAQLFLSIVDCSLSLNYIVDALKVYTSFYYAPQDFYLKALEHTVISSSTGIEYKLLERASFKEIFIKHKIEAAWPQSRLVTIPIIGPLLGIVLRIFYDYRNSRIN